MIRSGRNSHKQFRPNPTDRINFVANRSLMKVALYISCILLTSAFLNGCVSAPPAPAVEIPAPLAKSGASFEETRTFIVDNLMQYGGQDWNPSQKITLSNVQMDNSCALSFLVQWYFAGEHQDEASSSYTVTIPLGAVTQLSDTHAGLGPWRPNGIRLDTGNVNAISTSGDANEPAADSFWVIDILRNPQSGLNAVVPDSKEDMQGRLKRALAHMVDICQGSYAPSKALQQPF